MEKHIEAVKKEILWRNETERKYLWADSRLNLRITMALD